MGVAISYMGTKHRLAAVVRAISDRLPEGPFLDAFSGMCAVGEAIGPTRQVWTNDSQGFPALVAKALFASSCGPLSGEQTQNSLEPIFRRNLSALEKRFAPQLRSEQRYLTTKALTDVVAGNTGLPYVGTDPALEHERRRLSRKPTTFPYRMATLAYVGSFFGVRQCMEIDSIRYAIDFASETREISRGQRIWLLVGLGQAISRVNNSTGQFAEYLKPHPSNLHRILAKRRRSVWNEFLLSLDRLSPVGPPEWRRNNRCFRSDTLILLSRLASSTLRPTVVYADPPSSLAQHSRYYHVLDAVVEYRYPPAIGVGRYPDRRFQSPFAHATTVLKAMDSLVERTAKVNAVLILNYPSTGLFLRKGGHILSLLRRHYSKVEIAHTVAHSHSTFGSPSIVPALRVMEHIYLASH